MLSAYQICSVHDRRRQDGFMLSEADMVLKLCHVLVLSMLDAYQIVF